MSPKTCSYSTKKHWTNILNGFKGKYEEIVRWGKVFQKWPSKICGNLSLKKLKWYGLFQQTLSQAVFQKFCLVHSWRRYFSSIHTLFQSFSVFYSISIIPWKHQKTFGFLTFSGGLEMLLNIRWHLIKWEYGHEMG